MNKGPAGGILPRQRPTEKNFKVFSHTLAPRIQKDTAKDMAGYDWNGKICMAWVRQENLAPSPLRIFASICKGATQIYSHHNFDILGLHLQCNQTLLINQKNVMLYCNHLESRLLLDILAVGAV